MLQPQKLTTVQELLWAAQIKPQGPGAAVCPPLPH